MSEVLSNATEKVLMRRDPGLLVAVIANVCISTAIIMVHFSNKQELGDDLILTTLKDDLAEVLDKDFGYKGSLAYSENCPDAPNPSLTIADIGPISLPLSEIDAKRIIACAIQTPFGLETSTVVGMKVRNTWQIDPSLVSFQNPAWDSFLKSNIASICFGLGLPGGYDIQYRLHNLLLYETGSHFLPHPDIQKEDGTFATMDIVLPSQYTGGEIFVSHGSTSEVIDVSASCTSISVLSWYTDVMHQVKPIKSGYRLVLSYNLIRRSFSRPEVVPTTKKASELDQLHQILERWRAGGYRRLPKQCMERSRTGGSRWLPEQRMVAYIFGHQYSESDLDLGRDALKGQDVHKVNQICWVAEMLGFELWLAKFKLCTMFEVEDDSGEEETWTPECRIESDCTLEYITDPKGNRVGGKIEHFEGLIGADSDYMGNPIDQEFERSPCKTYRTALVIFNNEDMHRVMIAVCGIEYGLDKLKTSLKQDNATPDDKKIIDILLQNTRMKENDWKTLAEFPLRLHDLGVWNRIIKCVIRYCYRALTTLKEEMFLAWDMFGFQQVQSGYNTISKGYNGDTMDFIHEVKARAARLDEQEIVGAWCEKHVIAFVKGIDRKFSVNREEISRILVSIAKEDGIRFLKDFNGCSYECTKVARLLISEKENICAAPANDPGYNKGENLTQIFGDLLDRCIRGPIQYLYDSGYLLSATSSGIRQGHINVMLEAMELCIVANRVDKYTTSVFRLIWDVKPDSPQELMLYYIPIILRLRTRLPELGTNLLSPPFATFARNVIGYYLSLMLGSKMNNPRPSLQMPWCNKKCSTCASLHDFLKQSYVPIQVFNISRKTRKHFVNVVSQLSNFIFFTEVAGGRYRVAKRRDFFDLNRWEYRLEQARDFLKSIGDDEFIEQLMGDRFDDLKVALEGKSSYNYTGYE